VSNWFRLNPGDCCFAAFDRDLKERGYIGSYMMVVLEAAGPLDPAKVSVALQRAMDAHPIVSSRLRISRLRAWPYWQHDGATARPKYRHHDLSGRSDWLAAAEELSQEHLSPGLDSSRSPQVSVEHYQGPDERHRLYFFCPHALMDGEGLQLFVQEVDRLGNNASPAGPAKVLADHETADPLADYGWWRRFKLVSNVLRHTERLPPIQEKLLEDSLPDRPVCSRRLRYIHRPWSPDMVAQLQRNARKTAPAGPSLYARYVAGCVLRAVYRLYQEYGLKLPYCAVPFPIRVPRIERRPVPGNYLVSARLTVPADRLADSRAVAEDVRDQVFKFHARGMELSSWSFLRLTSQLRSGQYRRLAQAVVRNQTVLTGFTFAAEVDPPLHSFLGASVVNLWGGGVASIPPGWNPCFNKFRDRMNFTLSWPEAMFPEPVVKRYVELIEEEVFGT
jgi:hypothetical protein